MAACAAATKDDLSKLLCDNCKKYLSVPPIRMKAGKFLCGRCDSSGERVSIYEELAKFITFPCSNKPCPTLLKWGEVEIHESNCKNSVLITCPKPNCVSYWNKVDLQKHIIKNHKELVHKNKLEINRRLKDIPLKNFNKDKVAYLLQNDEEPYLVMVYSTCKNDINDPMYIGSYSFSFGAFYLEKNEKTKTHYDLTVTVTDDDGHKTVYSWYNEPLKEYDSDKHCLSCLDSNCHKGHYYTNTKIFLCCRLNNLVNDGCNYNLSYSVKLVDGQSVTNNIHSASSSDNSTLSSKFECPICYEFLTTPIYNCTNGHSLCSKCKSKVSKCALCQADVGNSRNYVLENISESLEICCPNAIRGCSYIGNVSSTKQHLVDCKF